MHEIEYTTEDLIRLEARSCALEHYIREHDAEGSWFLDQEFYKWLTVASAHHGNAEITSKLEKEKHAHEERCREEGIEIKFP